MTTFHDQPPRSRREARESERALRTEPGVDYMQFLTPEQEEEYRAARESAHSVSVAPGSRRALRAAGPANAAPEQVAQPEQPEPSQFRVRDYSPDGGTSVPSNAAAPTPPPLVEPPAGAPISLDYRPSLAAQPSSDAPPLTRRELRLRRAQEEADAAAATAEPATPAASALSNAIAEFESLARAKQERDSQSSEPGVSQPELPPSPVLEEPVSDEAAPVEAVVDEPAVILPEAVISALPATDEPSVWPFGLTPAQSPEPSGFDETVGFDEDADVDDPVDAVVEEEPAPVAELPTWVAPTEAFTFALPASATSVSVDDEVLVDDVAPVEEAAADKEPVADLAPEFVEPPVVRESYEPPVGHWSRQAELADDDLPFENTLSREVGAGHSTTTTSALILPSIPQNDFASLINATGEIRVTGTIDLPHGLSTVGADSRHLDDPNVDHMFDAFDKELVSNDSQPVRAIRAVSTHTQTRGVIAVPSKPPSNRLLKVAVIAACVLAVAVVGFLGVYVVNTL